MGKYPFKNTLLGLKIITNILAITAAWDQQLYLQIQGLYSKTY
jgi:hypothetical protein